MIKLGLRGETGKKKQKHTMHLPVGAAGSGIRRLADVSLPSLYSGPPPPAVPSPAPASPPPSPPTWPALLIQLRRPEGICLQVQDRRRTTLFFFPAKKVMKGQEGRPPKDCVRLDGQMLLER